MTPRAIALAGFMGAGKSTVGRIVAERLGWPFVDTDALIESRAGCTIAELFAGQGEPAFRALEAAVCQEAAHLADHVIALGGGALLHPQTRAVYEAQTLLIALRCDLEAIIARVGDDPARPLFAADRARLADLFAARAAHYASLPRQIDTTFRTPAQVAEEVIRLWQQQS